jgi:catechol 2,3-dioxygenase-like lactoylglutathione lyase family enzyme
MQRPNPHLGLHHVALRTTDMGASRSFWIDLMGYTVEWEPDADNVYLTMGLDNVALHAGPAPEGPQRLDHVGLLVASAEDVFAWERHLANAGIAIAQAARTHRDGATSTYVRSPENTLVQILHHPPISPALNASGLHRTPNDR